MACKQTKQRDLIPKQEKSELEFQLKCYCGYINGRIKQLDIPEETNEYFMMQTGIRHKSKQEVWASNTETHNVFPVVPLIFRDKELGLMNRLLGGMKPEIKRYVLLAYGLNEEDRPRKDKEIMDRMGFNSRTTYWRRKQEWLYHIYRIFKREKLL